MAGGLTVGTSTMKSRTPDFRWQGGRTIQGERTSGCIGTK